jgi:hypothetical protein
MHATNDRHEMRPGLVRGGEMRTIRIVTIAAGMLLAALGIWGLVAPRSFYDVVATYPPYHEHFLHDVGAFQLGLGVVLLLAVAVRDALLVALAGVGVGTAAHTVAHVMDLGQGGRASDPWLLGALSIVLLAAAARRWREVRAT